VRGWITTTAAPLILLHPLDGRLQHKSASSLQPSLRSSRHIHVLSPVLQKRGIKAPMEEISRASGSAGMSYGAHSNLCMQPFSTMATKRSGASASRSYARVNASDDSSPSQTWRCWHAQRLLRSARMSWLATGPTDAKRSMVRFSGCPFCEVVDPRSAFVLHKRPPPSHPYPPGLGIEAHDWAVLPYKDQ
jgi:hypothetical protein